MSVSRRVSMRSGEVREFGGGGVATGIRAFVDQRAYLLFVFPGCYNVWIQ